MRTTRSTLRAAAAALGAFCLTSAAAAQRPAADPRAQLVVSTAWLAQHLRDPDLVLLHVGAKDEYQATHIPGARFVSLQDVAAPQTDPDANNLEMPTADTLRARLAALGISDRSRVVVYFGKDWVSPTTRVLFTLDYAGLGARSALLDGGMGAWVRDGHEVTAEPTPVRAGTLSPLRVRPIVVDAEYVKAHIGKPGVAIVDGRAAAFYDGVQTGARMIGHGTPQARTIPHRTGHIASAHSVPFSEIADDSLRLRSPAELAALFARAGVQRGDTIVGYCHLGQQATAMLFAARTLGYPVLLYDGSFEDWSRHADFPVELTAGAGGAAAPRKP